MTPLLAFTAMVAMALIVIRAATQSITIDEATTYVLFVQNDQPFHWLGSSNNHVLNTALMRLTTRLFGVSELSARLPALLGAALYISACYRFCRRLEGGTLLQWAALACFLYSPLILDYLVAARGYSLALGFLMTALLADRTTVAGCVLTSTAIGLCFASNFSFAFVCAATWIVLFPGRAMVLWYTIPAALTVWLISLPSIVDFPSAELTYGSHSLVEMFSSILDSQGKYAVYAALPFAAATLMGRRLSLCAGVFAATLALHFVAFHAFGLLYPLDRTAIFFVPLAFAAIAVAAPHRPKAAVISLLLIAAGSFALLRLDQFEEWNFDADTRKIYTVLACAHQRNGVNRIGAGWPYTAALNFYRQTETAAMFDVVTNEPVSTQDTEAFVVNTRLNPTVIADRKLTVVWKSEVTEAVIALPQAQVARLKESACF